VSRIRNLPKRDWQAEAVIYAEELSRELRTPQGTQRLHPIQAACLLEAPLCGGLFANARVGSGKTLISGLLPTVFGSRRPLLLVPSNLLKKTRAAFRELRLHWRLPLSYRIESYSKLGTVTGAKMLSEYDPDLIVCDEAHKLKRILNSAVAKRVLRHKMNNWGRVRMCFLSGTFMRDGLMDYAHMLFMALGKGAPVPLKTGDQETWASLLDPRGDGTEYQFLSEDLGAVRNREEAQDAYRDRLVSAPGVIVSTQTYTERALHIECHEVQAPVMMDDLFAPLRLDWTAPDSWTFGDAFGVYACARQLGMGFSAKHVPWPPEDWYKARTAFCSDTRSIIECSDKLDSVYQIKGACERGELQLDSYDEWKELEPTFKVTRETVWHSYHVLDKIQELVAKSGRRTIVWTTSVELGRELERRTGWCFFQQDACDLRGRLIDNVRDKIVIASYQACREGHNLQRWQHNVFTSPPASGLDFEQWCSRTHRDYQTEDVTCDVLLTCTEDLDAVTKAMRTAESTKATLGFEQKLLFATVAIPQIKQQGYAFYRK